MAKTEDIHADIVVIGGGGAGIAAALAAAEKGCTGIIVLEKNGSPGGNSAIGGGLFAAESTVQKEEGIDATRESLFKRAMSFAHWKIDPRIVRAFIDRSADTIQWLEDKGLSFYLVPLYINQMPRTWHVPTCSSSGMMKILCDECRKRNVGIFVRAKASKILTDKKGNISGVLAETKDKELSISAKSVIIATGGSGANRNLLRKYYPKYNDNMEYIGVPNNGDGLKLAAEAGAAIDGISTLVNEGPSAPNKARLTITFPGNEVMQVPLTAIVTEPYMLWVNKTGKRFVDEAVGLVPHEGSIIIDQQADGISYTIFDDGIRQMIEDQSVIAGRWIGKILKGFKFLEKRLLPGLKHELQLQAGKGTLAISNSWIDIAGFIGANSGTLKDTVDEYNTACDHGNDPVFAKEQRYLMPLRHPPYYAIKCSTTLLDTIGGIRINHRMEVMDIQDNRIPGLYAAGVTTSGWEGDIYCYELSGSALGFAINSGRIAGENAVAFTTSTGEYQRQNKNR